MESDKDAALKPNAHRDFIEDTLKPSIKAGVFLATAGVVYGALHGIRKGNRHVIWAITYGTVGFVTGVPFWAIRSSLLDKDRPATPRELVLASAASGFTGGAIGGIILGHGSLLRYNLGVGRGSLLRYSFGVGILCTGAQFAYNLWQKSRILKELAKDQKPKGNSWLNSKWSPITALSDEEYKEKLQAQIDRMDAEIEIIDEKIRVLKSEAAEEETKNKAQEKENEESQA